MVRKEDQVCVVGDFALTNRRNRVAEVLANLNGTKFLVRGNHDHWSNEDYRQMGFAEVYDKPIALADEGASPDMRAYLLLD